jgi:hypothetical protein
MKMNKRQEALYNYLIERADEWTSQSEVARELSLYYGNGECYLAPEEYHDTAERKLMSRDCAEINLNPDYEKIIISSGKGIKIANESEAERYLRNQYAALFRKLKRIRAMERKCNLHNQMDFGGHTVEAFLENIPETP